MAFQDPPDTETDELRRMVAGRVLHAQLAGRRIPPHVAGIPDRLLVERIARMDAREVLAVLADIYDVQHWSVEEFERVFVRGALAGWRPGSLVQRSPGRMRVVSTTCPLASDVDADARVCEGCRAFQRHAAYLSMIGQVESAGVTQAMSRGDGACELNVVLRRRDA